MKRNSRTKIAFLCGMLLSSLQANAQVPAPIDWSDAPYCRSDTGDDPALREFREEVAYVLMRAAPSAYAVNVCVYRESNAFPGGGSLSLVATLDAENAQGLPTQPHPTSTDVTCASTGDVPCKRVRFIQLHLPETHSEAVRLPSAPTDNSKRVVAIVRDAS